MLPRYRYTIQFIFQEWQRVWKSLSNYMIKTHWNVLTMGRLWLLLSALSLKMYRMHCYGDDFSFNMKRRDNFPFHLVFFSLSPSFALSFTKLMIMQVMTASNVIRLMSHRIECLIVTWTFDIQNDYPLTTMCSLWNAYKIFKLMCYLSFQAVDCDLTATIVKDWVAQRNLHNKLYELLLKCAHFYVNVSRMWFFCVWLI